MQLTTPTLVTLLLVSIGAVAAAPVLAQGFRRRGKGVRYERSFLIQRAPQVASVLTIAAIALSFLTASDVFPGLDSLSTYITQWHILPEPARSTCAWIGIGVLLSGLFFMIGGWYSLGECFSTDAEVLDGQTVRRTGLLKFVMHPAYSGIIQSLVGASLAATSLPSILLVICVVAPLWLNRAKYEEQLMLETFGSSYEDYARELKWRRLIPPSIPIGI